MINVIFYLIILGMCLNTFSLSLSFGHVNRSFLMLACAIPESSVVVTDDLEPYSPYYDEEYFQFLVKNYLQNEITDYVDSAEVRYFYYYPEDESMCTDHHCQGASVTLIAKIKLIFTYEKTLTFSILKGDLYE
ncbi:MAG: hypothetical protein WC366_02810 [Bacilli bacterium]